MKTIPKSPAALLSIASIGILLACGPFYAPRVLDYYSTVIEKPKTNIELMFPNNKLESDAHRHMDNLPERLQATLDADIADLKNARPKLEKKLLTQYTAIRKDMIVKARMIYYGEYSHPEKWLNKKMLEAIPTEFALYLKGAVKYRTKKTAAARAHWKKLLKMPAAERKYRSVWAAWMLARTSTKKGEGMRWYQKVLELKKTGFPDSLDVTDKDWSAYFAYRSGDYVSALSSYIIQGKESKIDSMEASRSIHHVFAFALEREKDDMETFLKTIASKKNLAISFSYYLGKDELNWEYVEYEKLTDEKKFLSLWVEALIHSDRMDKDKELGITATAAYAIHDDESPQICLNKIKTPTIDSLWLKAKQDTFSGDLVSASKNYLKLTEMTKSGAVSIENAEGQHLNGYREASETAQERLFWLYSEYASVELGQKNYGKALDLFLQANNLEDAAYIAENCDESDGPLASRPQLRNSAG